MQQFARDETHIFMAYFDLMMQLIYKALSLAMQMLLITLITWIKNFNWKQ